MNQPVVTKRMNLSNASAIKKAREMLSLSRNDLATRLNCSGKLIEKYENGRTLLNHEKMKTIIAALKISEKDFQKIKKGKNPFAIRPIKKVLTNIDRRSYQKIITKDVKVLKMMRKMKNLSQDQASYLCGYSRPTIGHIENGRITLPLSRIMYIVKCYGYEFSVFEKYMKDEVLRDSVIEKCQMKMSELSDEKLKLMENLLMSF